MSPPEPKPFPWSDVMCFGLGVLRLPPADFWAMTPREVAAAMDVYGDASHRPPTPAAFAALADAFPDMPDSKRTSAHDR